MLDIQLLIETHGCFSIDKNIPWQRSVVIFLFDNFFLVSFGFNAFRPKIKHEFYYIVNFFVAAAGYEALLS